MSNTLTFASNQLFDTFRTVEQGGKEFLVVKGVPLVEGVLNGRFVSADEFGTFTNDWNDVPVVLRHPKKNGGSARVPATDVPVVGRFYNAKMDGQRLVGEYWLDKGMLENSEEGLHLLDLISGRHPIETSTGYWSESIPQTGKYNDRSYGLVDRNIHPDHIALLPDEIGACSLADGCGLNRNSAGCPCAHAQESLSQNVTGSLPAAGKAIYERVYKKLKDEGKPDEDAAKQAWGAVKNAGWKQGEDGEWVKSNSKTSTSTTHNSNQHYQRDGLADLAVVLLFADAIDS